MYIPYTTACQNSFKYANRQWCFDAKYVWPFVHEWARIGSTRCNRECVNLMLVHTETSCSDSLKGTPRTPINIRREVSSIFFDKWGCGRWKSIPNRSLLLMEAHANRGLFCHYCTGTDNQYRAYGTIVSFCRLNRRWTDGQNADGLIYRNL